MRASCWFGVVLATFAARGVTAHEGHDEPPDTPPAAIAVRDGYRYIESDGLPNHETGEFPNEGNPNTIRAQHYSFRAPAEPVANEVPTPVGRRNFGVAVNGVVFDPGTAEFWNDDHQSGWRYEAMGHGMNLGLDENHAHVQPSGAYHYHALPTGLVERLGGVKQMLLLGYAADGFPIYGPYAYSEPNDPASELKELTSSYRLKDGDRPDGPGGRYDGTFVQDYEYVDGAGDLDECNGRSGMTPEYPEGTYYYVITSNFPFVPRLFRGTPDESFEKQGPPPPPRPRRRPPPPR
jgi:hypothetical protein